MTTRQGQNSVEPIRDPEKIRMMKEYLLHKSYRDYFLFTFGINSGLRISDILPLRVMDVRHTEHLRIREKKTGNVRKIKMSAALKQEIEKYTRQMADSDPLFPSRKGKGPIGRQTAWRAINEASRACGIEGAIGTHTMRKTFGYHFYQQTKDVAMLQQIFGHSSPSITLRYIGINDEMIDKALDSFSI
ncbi:site-specific integrase [Bacillus badius]|uniref:Phage integrase: site-specific recombinase n=1 Tax=Bacillus badius TaxID=1455 RepID=A0ABR5ANN7_BACBA|nr:site-specific integrase [Bacillus badius]KIL71869.1 Phage integrase [Bacillus badius]KIL72496.1 Phage integrase: site-specific recombinase [Bacillus badius]MED4718455.1 site-specific integrase [Bacillus badius]